MSATLLDRPRAAAPPPRAHRPGGSGRDRARLAETGLVAGATCGSLLALDPVLQAGRWTGVAVVAVLVVATVTGGVRLLARQPGIGPVAGALVAGCGLLVVGGAGRPWPDASALRTLAQTVTDGITTIRDGVPPVPADRGITLLVVVGALSVLLLADLCVSVHAPALAGFALLPLWVPAITLGFPVSGWVLVWTGLPWLALLGGLVRSPRRAPALLSWSAVLVVLALVLAPVASRLPSWASVPLPHLGTSSGPSSLSDDLDLRRNLQSQSGSPLLAYTLTVPGGSTTATSAASIGPLRSFTMSDFDGTSWTRSTELGRPEVDTDRIDGGLLAPDDRLGRLPDGTRGTLVQVDVNVLGLADRYLPITTAPRTLSIDGTWRYDQLRDLVVGAAGTTSGLHYRMVAELPSLTADQLRAVGTSDQTDGNTDGDLDVPDTSHRSDIAAIALRVVGSAGTEYDQALALQTYFRSGAFVYDTRVPLAATGDAVWDFLSSKRGYCVHFATAMTMMARTLGIPARIAVGTLPGTLDSSGRYLVTGRQAHAWPELWFDGIGWVRFEPTPAVQTGAPPAWTTTTTSASPSPADDDNKLSPLPSAAAPVVSTSAAATPSARGAGGSALPPLGVLGLGLVVLLGGVALVALVLHRRGPGDLDPETAWRAARGALARAGVIWSDADSPRRAVTLARSSAVGVGEPALQALAGLSGAVEQSRYAPAGSPATPRQLHAWLTTVRAHGAGGRRRRARPAAGPAEPPD